MRDVSLLTWVFIGQGVLSVLLGIPMARGMVPPNAFYGFRTPKTLSKPEIWYSANRKVGIELAIAGAISAVTAALVALIFRGQPVVIVFTDLAVMLTTLIVVVVRGFLHLRDL